MLLFGRRKKYEIQECKEYVLPVRDFLDLVSGKWKIPIIVALSFGTRRFKELESDIAGITPKMLSRELSDLEQNLLITRKTINTAPQTVTYALTDYGKTLDKIIADMRTWGKSHRAQVFGESAKVEKRDKQV